MPFGYPLWPLPLQIQIPQPQPDPSQSNPNPPSPKSAPSPQPQPPTPTSVLTPEEVSLAYPPFDPKKVPLPSQPLNDLILDLEKYTTLPLIHRQRPPKARVIYLPSKIDLETGEPLERRRWGIFRIEEDNNTEAVEISGMKKSDDKSTKFKERNGNCEEGHTCDSWSSHTSDFKRGNQNPDDNVIGTSRRTLEIAEQEIRGFNMEMQNPEVKGKGKEKIVVTPPRARASLRKFRPGSYSAPSTSTPTVYSAVSPELLLTEARKDPSQLAQEKIISKWLADISSTPPSPLEDISFAISNPPQEEEQAQEQGEKDSSTGDTFEAPDLSIRAEYQDIRRRMEEYINTKEDLEKGSSESQSSVESMHGKARRYTSSFPSTDGINGKIEEEKEEVDEVRNNVADAEADYLDENDLAMRMEDVAACVGGFIRVKGRKQNDDKQSENEHLDENDLVVRMEDVADNAAAFIPVIDPKHYNGNHHENQDERENKHLDENDLQVQIEEGLHGPTMVAVGAAAVAGVVALAVDVKCSCGV